MAHVYKRGKTWAVRFSKREKVWNPKTKQYESKLKQKQKGSFHTKAEANAYGIKMEAEAQGGVDVTKDYIFKNYIQKWFLTVKIQKLSNNTIRRFNAEFRLLKNNPIAYKSLKDITMQDYQSFINSVAERHAISTVKHLNTTIRSCVCYAIDEGIISKNFTNQVEIFGNSSKNRKVDYLNLKDLSIFYKACKKGIRPSYNSRYMIITAILTGMRIGEIGALHWDDIDFNSNTISITKSYDLSHHEMGPTKNRRARTIAVPSELLFYLKQLKTNHTEFVFGTKRTGYPPKGSDVNKAIQRILKKCNISNTGITIHSFRHSHVAYLLSRHVDIYAISRRLGHSNISITLNTYAYMMKEFQDEENQKIINSLKKI